MKAVEIEFLMKDNLTAALGKSKEAVGQLLGKAKQAASLISGQIEAQRKEINRVTGDLEKMQQRLATMKPGPAQLELAADAAACKKALSEELGALESLQKQHDIARQGVGRLEAEYKKMQQAEEQAAAGAQTLKDRIAAQKDVIRQVEADVKNLQKAYDKAAPGNAQSAALAELNAAKKVLAEEKGQLAALTAEQERNRESNRRLSLQLRELQDAMVKMRLNGEQDTEEYRRMATEAAKLRDTIADLQQQTRILSDDDANLKGLASGLTGLTGAFSAAMGVMGLFASENENLAKIQTRVQSVMAVTIGLQQAFNALNKDSAFRLVTVVKMQNLLTAANTRLAAAFGISTTAANVLLGTLTLGLSVAVTGMIVAWNRYSAAQEEATRRTRERVEAEADGRAQMMKTRFEIDTTRETLKKFSGSKEEEKKMCDELNRKYGEAFGYYDSVAKWYDVLSEKAEAYVQVLLRQANVQAWVNKAAEVDAKINETKAKDAKDFTGGVGGWFQDILVRVGSAQMNSTPGVAYQDADAIVKNRREGVKAAEIAKLEKEKERYLALAKKEAEEKAKLSKVNGLGGHAAHEKQKIQNPIRKDTTKDEQRRSEELLTLIRKNQQDEIRLMKDGAEKKKAQVKQEYKERLAELKTQEEAWRKAQGGRLTASQQKELGTARTHAAEIERKALTEIDTAAYKEQLQAMRDYLKEYGTMQQQRLAIAETYAEKIKKATTEGERKRLARERDAQIEQNLAAQTAESIDFSTVFGNVGNVLRDVARETLRQVEQYMQSDAFKRLEATNKKTYVELREKLRKEGAADSVSPFNFKIWGTIEQQVKKYQDSVRDLQAAQKAHTAAVEDLQKANEKLSAATDDASKAIAKKALDIAQGQVDETVERQTSAEAAADEAKKNLTDSTNAAAQGIQNFAGYLNEMSNGSLYGFANGLTKLITSLASGANGVGKSLEQLGGKVGGIVGAILQILDALGDDPAAFIGGLIEKITNAIDGILDQIASGQLIETLVKSIFNLIGTVIEHAIFDPINVLTGKQLGFYGSNEKEVAATTERLTRSNDALQKSIDRLKAAIDKSGGMEAVRNYDAAYRAQKDINANAMGVLRAQMRYHRHHHSNAYYWDRDISAADYADMNAALRIYEKGHPQAETRRNRVGSLEDIYQLTPEQMQAIQTHAVEVWEKMLSAGKYDKSEYWEKYLAQAGKLEELTEKINQNLTQVSFSSLKSEFVSNILDMKKDAAGFADDFTEMMAKAWVNAAVSDLMDKDLEKFYKNWAAKMKAGRMTKEDVDAQRKEYQELVDQALKIRDQATKITGYDSSKTTTQTGKAGGFTAMSQDQGTKLEGLFVSGQMHWASMDDRLEDVAGKMNSATAHLAKIEENTRGSKETLVAIKDEIVRMVRDGVKMK